MVHSIRRFSTLVCLMAIALVTGCSLMGDGEAWPVPDELTGTWFFFNPRGDDEQMAIFPEGRVVVQYGNGHIDETRYADGALGRLNEYGVEESKLRVLEPDLLVQYGAYGPMGKIWNRIDPQPQTALLRPLTE